jgi:hypothetical protein
MRTALFSTIVLAGILGAASVQAADQAGCMAKQNEYMKRLTQRDLSPQDKETYSGEIAGATQRCMSGEPDAWEQIEYKLPKQ